MTTVRFRKHIGPEERRVYVHAAVGGEEVPGRGTALVVDFDRVLDVETRQPVSVDWFEQHISELQEEAVYAMKDKIHRGRVPVGA